MCARCRPRSAIPSAVFPACSSQAPTAKARRPQPFRPSCVSRDTRPRSTPRRILYASTSACASMANPSPTSSSAQSTTASNAPRNNCSMLKSYPGTPVFSRCSRSWRSSTSPASASKSQSSKLAWAAASTPPTLLTRSSPLSPTFRSTTRNTWATPLVKLPARRPESFAKTAWWLRCRSILRLTTSSGTRFSTATPLV